MVANKLLPKILDKNTIKSKLVFSTTCRRLSQRDQMFNSRVILTKEMSFKYFREQLHNCIIQLKLLVRTQNLQIKLHLNYRTELL